MSKQHNTVSDHIRAAWQRGEPAGWFEGVYANAKQGAGRVPWAHMQPNPALIEWAKHDHLDGSGKRALVVGCGLGDDAEALADMGFTVTAFDISPTAIDWCKQRFPASNVNYQVMDLFAIPGSWHGAFDFVLESRTIQALPVDLAAQTISAIAACVAPAGRVLVLCRARDENTAPHGIPWPLSRRDLAHFVANGLEEQSLEAYNDGSPRFRAVYRRPPVR